MASSPTPSKTPDRALGSESRASTCASTFRDANSSNCKLRCSSAPRVAWRALRSTFIVACFKRENWRQLVTDKSAECAVCTRKIAKGGQHSRPRATRNDDETHSQYDTHCDTTRALSHTAWHSISGARGTMRMIVSVGHSANSVVHESSAGSGRWGWRISVASRRRWRIARGSWTARRRRR